MQALQSAHRRQPQPTSPVPQRPWHPPGGSWPGAGWCGRCPHSSCPARHGQTRPGGGEQSSTLACNFNGGGEAGSAQAHSKQWRGCALQRACQVGGKAGCTDCFVRGADAPHEWVAQELLAGVCCLQQPLQTGCPLLAPAGQIHRGLVGRGRHRVVVISTPRRQRRARQRHGRQRLRRLHRPPSANAAPASLSHPGLQLGP